MFKCKKRFLTTHLSTSLYLRLSHFLYGLFRIDGLSDVDSSVKTVHFRPEVVGPERRASVYRHEYEYTYKRKVIL